LKSEAWLIVFGVSVLAPEQIYNPDNQRQRNAQHNAGHDWKIEAAIFSLIRNIAGQTANSKGQSATQGKESAYDHKRDSTEDEQFPEFARRFHVLT
jgi:hypothetical protein